MKDIISRPEVKLTATATVIMALVSACSPASPRIAPEKLTPTPTFDVNACINYQDPLREFTGEVNRGKCLLEELLQAQIGFYDQPIVTKKDEAVNDPTKLITGDYRFGIISKWFYLKTDDQAAKERAQKTLNQMVATYHAFQPDKHYLTLEDIHAYSEYLKSGKLKTPDLKTIDIPSNSDQFAGIFGEELSRHYMSSSSIYSGIIPWEPSSALATLTLNFTPALIYVGPSQK